MFKIVVLGDPIQIEMSREVLDIAVRISTYIEHDFDGSDFFTLGNVGQEDFSRFCRSIESTQRGNPTDQHSVSLSLDLEGYRLFERVIWYGANFGDDIPQLEAMHDDICTVSEDMNLI